jgi:hypothetical protein
MNDYLAFLASKAPRVMPSGVLQCCPTCIPCSSRTSAIAWRSASSSGGGAASSTPASARRFVQLEWCKHAADATNGMALILTPLAVAAQIVREAKRFGYTIARQIRDQSEAGLGINVCNYDRLDHLTPAAFGAVALDESSILKSLHRPHHAGADRRLRWGPLPHGRDRHARAERPHGARPARRVPGHHVVNRNADAVLHQ